MDGTVARDIFALFEAGKRLNSDINLLQFVVCLYVFAELKLAEYSDNMPLKLLQGKAELTDSKLYGKLIDQN